MRLSTRMRRVAAARGEGRLHRALDGGDRRAVEAPALVREGLALDRSHAYSDSFSDYPMLAVVGHPAAVNPDLRLRSVARAYEWPVLSTAEA